jgi:hypothetical protein
VGGEGGAMAVLTLLPAAERALRLLPLRSSCVVTPAVAGEKGTRAGELSAARSTVTVALVPAGRGSREYVA